MFAPTPPPFCSYQPVELAKAEAENIKLLGTAEAVSIEAVGRADAERMRMKAAAYRQYGDAAMASMVLQALPKVRPDRPPGRTEVWTYGARGMSHSASV